MSIHFQPQHNLRVCTSALLAALLTTSLLTACGGGGGGSSSSQMLTGVAATGAAMAGATVSMTDANGTTLTKTTAADGSYSADVSSLMFPLVVTASLQVGDTTLTLTSLAMSKPAVGSAATANITPLTHAIAALVAPNGSPDDLQNAAARAANLTPAKVLAATNILKAALANTLLDAGMTAANFDPLTTTFTANRTGADRVLELVRIDVTGQGVSLTNPHLADNGTGSASVVVTAASTPATVTALPAPPANTVLGEQDHFAALADACLADPPGARAPMVVNGVPHSLSAACAAMPFASNYKSGGSTFMQRYAGLLTNADYTGAKFGKPERVFTYANGRVFFRMPFKTASGIGSILTDVAEKTNPVGKSYAWEAVGNQRDYDSAIEARLDSTQQLNPSNTSESNKSQYRVGLRLFFNPINAAGLRVQVARIKGPGLPASGVVMHRSSVCGTNDYMTISNKTGAIVNSSGNTQLYNNNTGNNFTLTAELKSGTYDWTKVAGSSFWSTVPKTDAELAAIPSFPEYTWELWFFDASGGNIAYRNNTNLTNTTPADVTYTQRLTSRLPSVATLKTMRWNTIEANDFLNPISATLSAIQATATLNWTASADPVDYVSTYGQRNTVAVGATPASTVRVIGDSLVKISDTSKTVTPATDVAGISSLAGIVMSGGLSAPVIPKCTSANFPTLDAVTGTKDASNSYGTSRSMTIRSRSPDLARKYVSQSWNNFID